MSKKTRKGSAGQSRFYETVVVFDAQTGDDVIKGIVDKIKEVLTSHSAVNVAVDEWGKRKLAYVINKKTYGHYVCVEFEAPGSALQALNDYYHITEQIMRHMTMLVDSRLRAERKREKTAMPKEAVADEAAI
ncbi:MAG TPA: 30S ribosomal protein S6 [bacterium]|nr:30S ribosomal protein S6 [bacterium]HMW33398.1 30S ribosomal protein S6 [bacterium]HMW36795.1 30S ribosomal protein S6 [bacterium]HMY35998.1 30S ribosomal protein S6 [bacterium]HMZ05203.1 30S ribosomal protein S6 [bacterium]